MVTLEEFIKKNEGQFVEVAGSANAKFQCVDLANAYIRDVCGQPIVEWTNAIDFPKRINDKFEVIPFMKGMVLKPGDILIFDLNDNIGHISVLIKPYDKTCESFDQNWPLKSPCHLVTHNYTQIKWILRFINSINETIMTEEQKRILQFLSDQKATEGDVRQGISYVKEGAVGKLEEQISVLQKASEKSAETINDLTKKIGDYVKLESKWQTDLNTAKEELGKMEEDRNEKWNQYKKKNDEYNDLLKLTQDPFELIKLFIKLFKK